LEVNVIQKNLKIHGNDSNQQWKLQKLKLLHLKKMVRPEFLNRIDDTILFSPLSEEHIESIVELQLKHFQKLYKNKVLFLIQAQKR